MAQSSSRYSLIIESIFKRKYQAGAQHLAFERSEFIDVASELRVNVPKNLGDIVYTFRSRQELPESIKDTAPNDYEWVIQSRGRGRYAFELRRVLDLAPSSEPNVVIPDSTPWLVKEHAQSDEQSLLAKIRYNRLIDLFTGITCFHLQSHFRTHVSQIGQTETDDLYVGFDENGRQHILPIQAKGLKEKLSRIQIENDFVVCARKFPDLVAKPISAMQTGMDAIVLLEFEQKDNELARVKESHYSLSESTTFRDAVT